MGRNLRRIAVVAAGVAIAASLTTTTASAAPGIYALKIDHRIELQPSPDSNYSVVSVPVTIKCDPSTGAYGFYVFVSQPQAPNSFGFVSGSCTGKTQRYTVSVSSNYGTTYELGPATTTLTNFSSGLTTDVTIF